MRIVAWPTASSLQGEPTTREGVRKRAMESLPEGCHGFPGGKWHQTIGRWRVKRGGREGKYSGIFYFFPLRVLREPRVRISENNPTFPLLGIIEIGAKTTVCHSPGYFSPIWRRTSSSVSMMATLSAIGRMVPESWPMFIKRSSSSA